MWINVALAVMAYIAIPHVSFCRWMAEDGHDLEDRAVAILVSPAIYALWPLLMLYAFRRPSCR